MNPRQQKPSSSPGPQRARLAVLLAPLLTAGCAVGPDYERPQKEMPRAWQSAGDSVFATHDPDLDAWWTQFGDPVLDRLVERALAQGLDLREALARLREVRALRGGAAAEFLPTLDGTLSYTRRGESQNTPLGGFVPDTDLFAAGFDAAWELDLWGRIRRSVEAADAELEASIADVRGVALTVAAETAAEYVRFRAFETRSEIARENLRLQEQTLELVTTRFDAGLVGERDVAQAAANLDATRARVPALDAGAAIAEHRIAVLLGLTPGEAAEALAVDLPVPVPPTEIAVGAPADLLRRRPDVRAAERLLAAETARIGIETAELYPQLSLFGSIGLQSEEAGDLLEQQSGVFGWGPSLRWTLFDGGRRRARIDAQDARAEQALIRWERSVLVALEEAENAMTAFAREQDRHRALRSAVGQARRATTLARTQYAEGLSDFQAVLDSDRTLAELEDEVAQSAERITTQLIALYKALGGGAFAAGSAEA